MVSRGVVLRAPYASIGGVAKHAEAKGFDAVWVGEATQSATIQASVLAQATERVDIGTNITLAFPRSPVVTAMEAWDLNELAGDRFVVGLGSQVRRIIEERFSASFDRPARRMAEYVQAMQTVWRMEQGEDVTFDGEIYRVVRPGLGGRGTAHDRKTPRVYVAAVGPLMTKAAVAHADGLLGHPLTSDRYLAGNVVPWVEAALQESGRAREEFTLCQSVICCIADDRQLAVREAKQQIAFYGTTPNYQAVFASYGDEALTGRLRQVWKNTGQDIDALVEAVPDEAVQRYAVAGTSDEVRDRLPAIEQHVDHVILSGARHRIPPQRMAENLSAILETFGTDST